MRTERRKHKRFQIREDFFAAFVNPDGAVIVGRVLDASLCGASVQYLATSQLDTGPVSISIFGPDSPGMNRIESTVMYDLEVPGKSWNNPQTRRCGIRFEGRRPEIKAQLKEMFRVSVAAEPRFQLL